MINFLFTFFLFNFIFDPVLSYKNIHIKKNVLYLKNNFNDNDFNENNFNDNKIKILDIDFNSLIESFDNDALNKLNGKLPSVPENEDEIIDDSFEGYLKSEFYKIADIKIRNKKNKVIINFNTFYIWRKNIGTVLTDEELFNIFITINGVNQECDVMNFILTNKIIDENDGADF